MRGGKKIRIVFISQKDRRQTTRQVPALVYVSFPSLLITKKRNTLFGSLGLLGFHGELPTDCLFFFLLFFSCVAYCSTPLCHVYCIYTLPSTFGPGEIEATMPPYLLLVTGNDIARIERQSRWQQVSLVSVTMSFFSMYLYLCIPTGS